MARSLAELAERYVSSHGLRGQSAAHYRHAAGHFGAYLGRTPLVSDLSDTELDGLVRFLRERRGLAARTARNHRENLVALWRLAIELGWHDRFPLRMRRIAVASVASTSEYVELAKPAAALTLEELGIRYVRRREDLGREDHIVTAVHRYERWLGRTALLADLTDEGIDGWVASMIDGPLAPETIRTHGRALLRLWRFAATQKLIDREPPALREIPPSAADHKRAIEPHVEALLLIELFEGQYSPQRLVGRSEGNRHQYRMSISRLRRFLGRLPTIDDLNDQNIGRAMQWLLDRGRSPATANKLRDHLCAIWRFASRHRLVGTWPEVPAVPVPTRVPQAWTVEQIGALLATTNSLRGAVAGAPARVWWTALILVLFDSGERIGAMLQVRWEHFDAERRALLIPAEFRKGRHADALYELHADTVAALAELHRYYSAGVIFAWDKAHDSLWKHLRSLLIKAELPADRRSKFHRIRRTTASYVAAAGGNATEALKHSSAKVTARYLDPHIVGHTPAVRLLPRPAAFPSGKDAVHSRLGVQSDELQEIRCRA